MARDAFSEFDEREVVSEEESSGEHVGAEDQTEGEGQTEQSGEGQEEHLEEEPDRYGDLQERLRQQESRNDELTRMLLDQNKSKVPEEPEVPIDPDVEAAITPILDKRLKSLEAVAGHRQQEMQLDQLEELSPGFKERWPEVQKEFSKLPSHLQAEFDSMTGALALDGIMQKKTGQVDTSQTLRRRSHSEGRPMARNSSGKKGMTAEDVNNMTDAEFEAFLEDQRGGHGRPGEIDPLLR